MNSKVIIGGVIVIVLIIGAIYFMSKGSVPATAPAAATDNQQAASATASTSSPSQVQGQDVSIGTGAPATPGSVVSVLYVGKLQDGTVFDSSAAHGKQPLTFTLGTNGLIPGFQIGVNGMKVGGERLLSVPPTLGYGAQDVKDPKTGKVIIPANSTIIFDVKLINVTAGSSTSATH